MRKLLKRIFDYFLGINWSLGIVVAIWCLLRFFFEMPPLNHMTVCFLLLSVTIPWLSNFIFSYSSNLYIKGILHGVVWFILEIILFNLMFGYAMGASFLTLCAACFGVVYAVFLIIFSRLSAKLNTPVRHTAEFMAKLSALISDK